MAPNEVNETMSAKKSYVIDLTSNTEDIEKSFVSEKTTSIYNGVLVKFIMWLFDTHKDHIDPSILDDLIDSHEKDKLEEINAPNQKKNSRSNKKKKKNSNKRKKNENDEPLRRHFRASCKMHLARMKPSISGSTHNSPIVIQGENALTYEVIREFMMEKKKSAVISEETVKSFLKKMKKDTNVSEEQKIDGKVEVSVQQSISSYESIRSAIGYIYKMCRIQMPQHMQDHLRIFIAGKRRAGIKEKEELGLTITEGKRPLSQQAYELLAKTMFFSERKEHVFAHVFLVLDWTLMKRAENCVNCKVNHITFKHDSLVFEFAKSKSHQRGEKHIGPWHVYANPFKPWCCPVLSLARYFFAYPEVLKGDMPLFDGSSQYHRYHKIFSTLIKSLQPELREFVYVPGDLGSHSCRKGVATLIASGCTVSPPISSLCIRAGWVMGGMKDKYIFNEKAGDQYVGRCASLLNQLTKEFAVSPPYFDMSDRNDQERIEKNKEIEDYLMTNLPNAKKIQPKTWNMVMFCFASLCYHYEYLCKNLHKKSVLRGAPVFQNITEDMVKMTRVAYPWNSTKDTPTFTGIPPHVTTLAEFERVREELHAFKTSIPNTISTMLDDRGFSSTGLNTEKVIDFFKKASENMVAQILDRTTNSNMMATNTENNFYGSDFSIVDEGIICQTSYENLN